MFICMYVRLSVCSSVCESFCMYVRQYVCPSVCMFVCLYVSLHVSPSVCMSVCIYVRPYVCACTSMLSVRVRRFFEGQSVCVTREPQQYRTKGLTNFWGSVSDRRAGVEAKDRRRGGDRIPGVIGVVRATEPPQSCDNRWHTRGGEGRQAARRCENNCGRVWRKVVK